MDEVDDALLDGMKIPDEAMPPVVCPSSDASAGSTSGTMPVAVSTPSDASAASTAVREGGGRVKIRVRDQCPKYVCASLFCSN